MALIKTVSENEAKDNVKEIFSISKSKIGIIPEAFKFFAVSPVILGIQAQKISYFSEHKNINPILMAFIRLLISDNQKCAYCINMNSALLIHNGITQEQIESTKKNLNNAPLEKKEIGLLEFVLQAVNNEHNITDKNINEMKALGWSEQDIFDAMYLGANQIGINTLFNTFNLEPDNFNK